MSDNLRVLRHPKTPNSSIALAEYPQDAPGIGLGLSAPQPLEEVLSGVDVAPLYGACYDGSGLCGGQEEAQLVGDAL